MEKDKSIIILRPTVDWWKVDRVTLRGTWKGIIIGMGITKILSDAYQGRMIGIMVGLGAMIIGIMLVFMSGDKQ